MISQLQHNPWRTGWRFATSEVTLVVLLLGLAISLSLTTWLPQAPRSESEHARWLSETQARFGPATSTLQALGLLTITHSVGFRLLLALLAGCLLVRSVEHADHLQRGQAIAEPPDAWREIPDHELPEVEADLRERRYRLLPAGEDDLLQVDRWPWADLLPLLAHVGGLLLLIGLLLMHLWGWQVGDLTLQPGDQIALSDADWLAWDADRNDLTHSAGIIVHIEQQGPGVEASAFDENDQALALQQVAGAETVTQLALPLFEDQYFAIPDNHLIVRLLPEADDVDSPLRVQVYRSPPGRLIEESIVKDVDSRDLAIENVTLQLVRMPYARVSATFNPGRWPAGIGLLMIIAGLIGHAIWPPRRFWLREQDDTLIEGSGSLPPTLTVDENHNHDDKRDEQTGETGEDS